MWNKITRFFRKLTGTKYCENIDALIAYIPVGKLYRLSHWIDQCIEWKKDQFPKDEWKAVNITIYEGKGDCEDRALVAYKVISTWKGWTAQLLCVYPMDVMQVGHAVCCFERPDGKRGYLDYGVFLFDKGTDWSPIAKSVRSWVYSAIWSDEKGYVIEQLPL